MGKRRQKRSHDKQACPPHLYFLVWVPSAYPPDSVHIFCYKVPENIGSLSSPYISCSQSWTPKVLLLHFWIDLFEGSVEIHRAGRKGVSERRGRGYYRFGESVNEGMDG